MIVMVSALVMTSVMAGQPARADHVIILQCVPDQLAFNKYIYMENINGINSAVGLYITSHPNSSTANLASYMGKLYVWMKVIPEYAHCMREMGVDPSSVAQLSPQATTTLINDANDLLGFSPDFLKEVPIPGFTNTAYFPKTPIVISQEPIQIPNCGDKAFPTVNWSYCNFSNSNQTGDYLLEANLTGTNFSGAKLYGAYAFGAIIRGSNLANSDLRHTELAGSDLRSSILQTANLQYGSLDFANLQGADLKGANLSHTHGLYPIFYNATLVGTDLSHSNYVRADFEGANLSGATLAGTDLREADLNGTNLTGANLTGTVFTGANLHCIGNPICSPR